MTWSTRASIDTQTQAELALLRDAENHGTRAAGP
jgi:hypothetical protein